MAIQRKISSFPINTHGAVAIEFALILPVLLLFLVGVIDFGHWFFTKQVVERVTSNAANALQRDPSQGFADVNSSAGLGIDTNMSTNGNTICAVAATDSGGADGIARTCNSNTWVPGNPTGNPAQPYYIGIRSHMVYRPLIPLTPSWPPREVNSSTIVRINPTNANTIPACGANQYLTGNGTNFVCVSNALPNCAASNQFLSSDGSNFICVDSPIPPCPYGQTISWRQANQPGTTAGIHCVTLSSDPHDNDGG